MDGATAKPAKAHRASKAGSKANKKKAKKGGNEKQKGNNRKVRRPFIRLHRAAWGAAASQATGGPYATQPVLSNELRLAPPPCASLPHPGFPACAARSLRRGGGSTSRDGVDMQWLHASDSTACEATRTTAECAADGGGG